MNELLLISTIFFFFYLFVWLFIQREDRLYALTIGVGSFLLLSVILNILNLLVPFGVGGDDYFFFVNSNIKHENIEDFFSVSSFTSFYSQPGYPWLLSVIGNLFDHELILLKYINLAMFIFTAIVWMAIGKELEGREFGRQLFIFIILLTPLWQYFLFLYKDILVVLLQSIAIFILIRFWKNGKIFYVLPLILILFLMTYVRFQIITLILFMALGSIALRLTNMRAKGYRVQSSFIFIFIISLLVVFASNPMIIFQIGLSDAGNILAPIFISERIESQRLSSGNELFFLQYFLMETSIFQNITWNSYDSRWTRGFLSFPWIFFVIPGIFLGIWSLLFKPYYQTERERLVPVLSTPWSIIILYILCSMVISYIVSDTTRYRISDLPFLASVALFGFKSYAFQKNLIFIGAWFFILLMLMLYIL